MWWPQLIFERARQAMSFFLCAAVVVAWLAASAVVPVAQAQSGFGYVACALICPDGNRYVSAGGVCRDSLDACYNSFIGVPMSCDLDEDNIVMTMFSNNNDCVNYLNNFLAPSNNLVGPSSSASLSEKQEQVSNGTCACTDIMRSIFESIKDFFVGSVPDSTSSLCGTLISYIVDKLKNGVCATKIIGKIPVIGTIAGSFCDVLFDTVTSPVVSMVTSFCASTLDNLLGDLGKQLANLISQVQQEFNDVVTSFSQVACGPIVCGGLISGYCGETLRQDTQAKTLTAIAAAVGLCGDAASPSCFPPLAVVQLADGRFKYMKDLEKGDKVLADVDEYSPVFTFSHRRPHILSNFKKIQTEANHTLWLTPEHYLYVNRSLAVARLVHIGDLLTTESGEQVAVVEVSDQMLEGLYNPHTVHGDIFVNGIKTSSYTSAVSPGVAHALLFPARAAYYAGIDLMGNSLDHPSSLQGLLPQGQQRYAAP
eukprot:m.930376 g.930376  ORF g.930376 m.930376 type:complete len:481 (+) comp174817_c0_seq1:243-1685(+)